MMKMTGERLVAGVLEPQDLSNAVRDLAKAAFLHFPLMAAASSGAKLRLVEFSEQNLTSLGLSIRPIVPNKSIGIAEQCLKLRHAGCRGFCAYSIASLFVWSSW
eukprot:s4071_g4.t1